METTAYIIETAREFGLGPVQRLESITQGNARTYRLQTSQGVFFIKPAHQQPEEWLALYGVTERLLNAQGVRQARMMLTPGGSPASARGYSAFEFLPGEAVRAPNGRQFEAHVVHLAAYNRALRLVPIDPEMVSFLTQPADLWRRAASLEYMLDRFRLDPAALGISERVAQTTRAATDALSAWRPRLQRLSRQLVHSDIGPGNVLYDNDRVVAIVDFTPAYEPHAYALCISLFWHCVFDQPEDTALARIAVAVRIYSAHHVLSAEERACLYALMVRATAYRLFARLLARAAAGRPGEAAPFSMGSTEKMAGCVERVLRWGPKMAEI